MLLDMGHNDRAPDAAIASRAHIKFVKHTRIASAHANATPPPMQGKTANGPPGKSVNRRSREFANF